VDFRLQTMTDFLHEIARNAKSVNAQIKIIPEIYPGVEEEVIRVGADPYQIYPVVDAIAFSDKPLTSDDAENTLFAPEFW
jgi:hypothetical protein